MEISNNLRGVARQKGEDKAALRSAVGAGENQRGEEEVLKRG